MGVRADGWRQTEVLPETEELLGLAGRVADRERVDWPSELARAGASGSRPWLLALEAIDRLGAISASVEEELPAPFSPRPERRWGHLEVVGLLGRGSYGSVHVARDPQLDRLVALKLFGGSGRSSSRDEARREGRLLARLKHPNIATVYGFDEREGELGLWMELVRGQTLAARVAEQGPMGALEAALAGVEICRALAAAHAAGILHRDVKAQNVVREEGGRLVLVDFGLGLEDAAAQGARPSGTPLYLAPEVVGGHPPSVRSDLYAVGVLLYHLASGAFPVEARDLGDLVDRHARGERRPLRDRRPDLPQAFVDAVERATAERPEERFASAGEMERALLGLVSGAHSIRRPIGRAARLVVGAVVLFAIVGVVVVRDGMKRDAPVSPADLVPRRLTTGAGWESEPAISPDGTLVAYVASDAGNPDLWIVDSRGGEPLRLTDDPATDRWPAWLPDGSGLLFESDRSGSAAIWRVNRLGGPATFVLGNATEPAVSPEGRHLAVAALDDRGLTRIAVAPLDGSAPVRAITGADVGVWHNRSPAWSPDGRSIAFVDLATLWVVSAAGGKARSLTRDAGAEAPSWSHDGRWIYFNSNREGTSAIWRVPAAGGLEERVSLGTASESHPRLDHDGRRLVYSTAEDRVDLGIFDLLEGRFTAHLENSEWEMFPTFSPHGSSLAFVRVQGGEAHLWVATFADGDLTEPRPLVVGRDQITHPTFSPDGRYIAYQRRSGTQRDIYVVATAGGPSRPLVATDEPELMPSWSPTGEQLAFVRQVGGRFELFRQRLNGIEAEGRPEQLADMSASPQTQTWSPDGKRLAVMAVEAARMSDVWIVDASGLMPPSRLTSGSGARRVRWLDAERLVVAGTWGRHEVRLQGIDVNSGAISPLTPAPRFGTTSMAGFGFDISRDLRWLAISHGDVTGDVWVLERRAGQP